MSFSKYESELSRDPRVLVIANCLKIDDVFAITGRLMAVWAAVYHHIKSDDTMYGSVNWPDFVTGTPGMGEVMQEAGWLEDVGGNRIKFPGQYEKAESTKKYRAKLTKDHKSVTDASQECHGDIDVLDREEKRREEKRREEKITEEVSCPELDKPASEPADGSGMVFPTTGKQKTWELPASKLLEWQETFDTVDVAMEAKKAMQWLILR